MTAALELNKLFFVLSILKSDTTVFNKHSVLNVNLYLMLAQKQKTLSIVKICILPAYLYVNADGGAKWSL